MNVIALHPQAWSRLRGQRDRLPHALLLIGQRGLGKLALAETFAASLLCEQRTADDLPCGRCLACNWLRQGSHPDYRLLQPDALGAEEEGEDGKKEKASQQITIDQVRALDDFLVVGTHRAGLRIVIIHPAEAMNRNTANALLKTLEEPTLGTLFLLVSNEPLRLLPTIRSRCQVIPVDQPSAADAEAALAAEGIAEPRRWLALAGGSPGLAIELASMAQGGWLELLANRLGASQPIDPLGLAGELDKFVRESKGRVPLKAIVEAMQKWLVDLSLAANGLPVRYFLPQQAAIRKLADMIPPMKLARAYRDLLDHRRACEQPLNARLFLEGLFIEYRGLLSY